MPRTAHREQVLTPGAPARVRRKILLEWVYFVLPYATAAFFSALVFAEWSPPAQLAAAAAVAAALTAALLGFRRHRPPATELAHPSNSSDAERPAWSWGVITIAVLLATALLAVALISVTALGLIVVLAVISGATLGETALVAGLALGVSTAVELAVARPLARRWRFAI